VVKRAIGLALFSLSTIAGQDMVQVKLKNGSSVKGEFIGTYMDHIHLLIDETIVYYKCEDVNYITKSHIYGFDYDCSKNTVTPEILFPPQINPMTGEWETTIPDIFDPEKRKVAQRNEKIKQKAVNKTSGNQNDLAEKQMESLNNLSKKAQQKIKEGVGFINHNTKAFLEPDPKPQPSLEEKEEKNSLFVETSIGGPPPPLTEDEIRRLIKKEVRKQVRKALPYEIRKHNEEKQSKRFQNILLGCAAWFFFIMMLG
tara:strand:+ start:620 stop:1387 length:768 start_codon:yes stop_codon:yes gene_type:complete